MRQQKVAQVVVVVIFPEGGEEGEEMREEGRGRKGVEGALVISPHLTSSWQYLMACPELGIES